MTPEPHKPASPGRDSRALPEASELAGPDDTVAGVPSWLQWLFKNLDSLPSRRLANGVSRARPYWGIPWYRKVSNALLTTDGKNALEPIIRQYQVRSALGDNFWISLLDLIPMLMYGVLIIGIPAFVAHLSGFSSGGESTEAVFGLAVCVHATLSFTIVGVHMISLGDPYGIKYVLGNLAFGGVMMAAIPFVEVDLIAVARIVSISLLCFIAFYMPFHAISQLMQHQQEIRLRQRFVSTMPPKHVVIAHLWTVGVHLANAYPRCLQVSSKAIILDEILGHRYILLLRARISSGPAEFRQFHDASRSSEFQVAADYLTWVGERVVNSGTRKEYAQLVLDIRSQLLKLQQGEELVAPETEAVSKGSWFQQIIPRIGNALVLIVIAIGLPSIPFLALEDSVTTTIRAALVVSAILAIIPMGTDTRKQVQGMLQPPSKT
ncbi:hypothetical protein [Glycomyces harbinensis]|nr:hypothetical protein [Glycomyces harbinensis]